MAIVGIKNSPQQIGRKTFRKLKKGDVVIWRSFSATSYDRDREIVVDHLKSAKHKDKDSWIIFGPDVGRGAGKVVAWIEIYDEDMDTQETKSVNGSELKIKQ